MRISDWSSDVCSSDLPLAWGDDDDHRALAVAGREIAAEQAIDGVAEPRAVLAGIEHFGDAAHVGDRADRDVGEGQADLATFAGRAASLDRCEKRQGRIGAGQQIPGGENVIDRPERKSVVEGKGGSGLVVSGCRAYN